MAVSTIDPNGLNIGQIGGRRNLLINSAFNIWQRGTSFTAPANGTYTADRFAIAQTSSFLNVTRDTDTPDGFSYSLKTTVNSATSSPAAGDLARIYYTSEAQDVTQLGYGSSAAKTTSLSFWVKSTVAADYTVFVYVDDPARSIVKGYTINSANTWQYITITIAGDTGGSGINSDNGAGITLEFNLVAGSNYNTVGSQDTWTNGAGVRASGQTANCAASGATWQITGVQLELGDVATPFEHRSVGEELSACMRYYQKIVAAPASPAQTYCEVCNANQRTTSTSYGVFHHPVPMRQYPSLQYNTLSNLTLYMAATSNSVSALSYNGFSTTGSGTFLITTSAFGAAGNAGWLRIVSATDYIAFDAEL